MLEVVKLLQSCCGTGIKIMLLYWIHFRPFVSKLKGSSAGYAKIKHTL